MFFYNGNFILLDGIWKFLFLYVIKLKINMVYLGDDIRFKFNYEIFQLNFDFGFIRKAFYRGFYQKYY